MTHALLSPARRVAVLALVVIAVLALGACSKPKAADQAAEQATQQAAGKAAGTLKSEVKPIALAIPLPLPRLDGLVVSMPSPPRAIAPIRVAEGGTPAVSLSLGIAVRTPAANVSLGMPGDLGSILAGALQSLVPVPVPTAIPVPPASIPTPPVGVPPGATPPAGFGPPAGFPTPPAGFSLPPGFQFP